MENKSVICTKGVGGSHGHWLPDCTKGGGIDYSNFSTSPDMKIGSTYDIEGRNGHPGRRQAMASSLYNPERVYGDYLLSEK